MYFNKKNVYLLITTLAIVFCSMMFLYSKRNLSMTKVCESSIYYNRGIGLTFYVGKDGRTIDVIEKNDTISLDFIKKNLTDDEENSKKILVEYKENAEFFFNDTVEKYKDVTWFSADFENKDELVRATYTFDVSSKDFNYDKYKNIIEEFSLQYYFNKEENKFIYDESVLLADNTPLGSIEEIGCHDKTKEMIKKTEESK